MAVFASTVQYSASAQRYTSEHAKLLSLMNLLERSMQERQGRMVVSRILLELSNCALQHIDAEENAMRRATHPGLEEHAAEHSALSAKFRGYMADFDRTFPA
jgi:hemerythrin-like metal-binding protein